MTSSTAQLAAVHPTSGDAYTFGRRQLNDWAGFIAGWGFVTGKCASVAAMAFTLPPASVLTMLAVFAVGVLGRLISGMVSRVAAH